MLEQNRFGRTELFKVLQDISNGLDSEIDAYLIGGLSMMHHGLKVVTKDVDVVFKDDADAQRFEVALGSCGFRRATGLSEAYVALGATTVMERSDGMRFDIFVERVCKKLTLTEGMRRRAERMDLEGGLHLMATTPEDIFLFKSVTDREDDLADMALLAGLGLDWEAMVDELRREPDNYRYLPHFASKLDALEEVHSIVAPNRRALDEEVEVMMVRNILHERFRQDPFTLPDATVYLGEGDEFSKKVMDRMMERGMVHKTEGLYKMAE
jgi:hypothetical protein